jgi:acetoacetyl-CoA reductase/3-oxoacyl-[acyl-carrier protein] reductase
MSRKKKLALVTGASRGIGNATAVALLNAGYAVACGYHNNKAGAAALVRKHPDAFAVKIDIGERASVQEALKLIRAHFKRDVDVVVNNGGVAQEKPFEDISDADWDAMLRINLRGAFVVAQEVLPHMQKQRWGRIVNITSIGGQWGGMRQVHYAAAKAGLINLTHSLAKLYSSSGITANAVAPGLVATAMIAKELKSKAGKEKQRQIPTGRITRPEEIAAAVVYLVSDDAGSITGHTLNINGGLLMT